MWHTVIFVLFCGYASFSINEAKPITESSSFRPLTESELNQIGMECLNETKLDPKVIDTVLEGERILDNLPPEYKRFLSCSYKRQGYQKEDGTILYDNIYEFLAQFYNKGDLEKVMQPCKDHDSEGSLEEKAFAAAQCLINQLKTLD